MKLIFISSGLYPVPPVQGGAVEGLIDLFLRDNEETKENEITVVSVKSSRTEEEANKYSSTNFVFIDTSGLWNKTKQIVRKLINLLPGVYIGNLYIRQVTALMGGSIRDYDVVIVENSPQYGQILKKFSPRKMVLHLHNDLLNCKSKLAKKYFCVYDQIFTLSDYVNRQVRTIEDSPRVVTLYNGVDIQKFHQPQSPEEKSQTREKLGILASEKVILFSGRLVPEKGVKELIQAFARIPDKHDLTLLIVGSPGYGKTTSTAYTRQIEKFAKQCGGKVSFVGYVPPVEMPAIYSASDIAVVPSTWEEPFALSLVEAMAAGLPVLISDSGGMTEIVTSQCGLIAERGKDFEQNLCENLTLLLQAINLRKAMGEQAYLRSTLFSCEIYVERFKQLLQTTIEN